MREQAVHLMERANAVSLPGPVPNYEQVVSFRVHYLDGTTKEGSYSREAAGAAGYREEEAFGDYHAVSVRSGNRMSSTVGWGEPPEFRELREQLPVHLGRFDQTDVIRSIETSSVLGRPAKCILFETQFGNTLQHNQLCVDAERGALLLWQVGDETIENLEYFKLDKLWEPARINRSLRGALRMEIEQKISIIEGPGDPNIFTPPTSQWNKLFHCQTWRRAVGISTPQPPAGNIGTETIDIVVTGMIGENGKTEALKVQSSPRPDLNAEALSTVAQWTFQPMICDDKLATQGSD
ncbi:MAG TPA: energy transducer TonB, partial [Terriglobales bacterium]|nr:energy transducer TonB [Terriglobales bacterium]